MIRGKIVFLQTWVITKNGEQVKARLVARGFEEVEKVEKDSLTVAKSTMRILMSVAVSKGWTVKATDIKSAFLQGKEIQRDVYIKPPYEAKRPAGKLWKLKKTLYGLNDAERKFYDSIREELTNLALVQSKVDPSLFYKVNNEEVIGLQSLHTWMISCTVVVLCLTTW